MLSTITPAAGRLLISEPFMMDPNFKRAVILLTEYSQAGAMGFVLNHNSDLFLGDLIPEITYADIPVYKGGPVGGDTMHFIHRCPDKIDGGIALSNGIHWGGNFDMVKPLINNYQLTNADIRFFIGYSGWTEGQLDNEILEDTWMVTADFNHDVLFSSQEETLWKQTVISLGNRYAHIANFPENPALN
jgi:putative transcriptional regulator